ncbi:hypothetical protein LzC2_39220 [Planctomycetes bacterium LzC2]|uniref:Uncharacterized protein n=1 Tax=Alienimonas chondri TaxID=2681879 RepID=A0ABX1VIT5_9PLAN|nr:hypothetical protein [Alienimonas chondri]
MGGAVITSGLPPDSSNWVSISSSSAVSSAPGVRESVNPPPSIWASTAHSAIASKTTPCTASETPMPPVPSAVPSPSAASAVTHQDRGSPSSGDSTVRIGGTSDMGNPGGGRWRSTVYGLSPSHDRSANRVANWRPVFDSGRSVNAAGWIQRIVAPDRSRPPSRVPP